MFLYAALDFGIILKTKQHFTYLTRRKLMIFRKLFYNDLCYAIRPFVITEQQLPERDTMQITSR